MAASQPGTRAPLVPADEPREGVQPQKGTGQDGSPAVSTCPGALVRRLSLPASLFDSSPVFPHPLPCSLATALLMPLLWPRPSPALHVCSTTPSTLTNFIKNLFISPFESPQAHLKWHFHQSGMQREPGAIVYREARVAGSLGFPSRAALTP